MSKQEMARFLIVFAAALTIGAAPETVDRIVIVKSERTLSLMHGPTSVRTYRDVRLGDAPVGHKQFEGDEKTPEGHYTINGRNAQSRYHLSLRVSYPNTQDNAHAIGLGRSPGGDIFIHGQPNWSPLSRIPHDWTDGCIALSNAEMDEVWKLVRTGTPVVIRP